ncbi:hypothetical protein [Kitasatospora sp. NPDC088783]|uniref:hypothetical protein n=1 Tax=Kitasatospora sp. NPDC088783 TaxID=3364077 RepID=UPI0038074D72
MTLTPPAPTEQNPPLPPRPSTTGTDRWAAIEAAVLALPRSRRAGRTQTPLRILGAQGRESSHKHYLKFLLDPRESHGLGTGTPAALLDLAGRPELAADARLERTRLYRQVSGRSSRPNLVAIGPAASIVVELKIDAPEGYQQTARQADDFADLAPPVILVYLTPDGTSPSDGRFRPVSLRDLADRLAQLLTRPNTGRAAPGRRHAEDYLSDLEAVVGVSTDDEAARFWATHSTAVLAAQATTRRLLRHLPEHTAVALAGLAPNSEQT